MPRDVYEDRRSLYYAHTRCDAARRRAHSRDTIADFAITTFASRVKMQSIRPLDYIFLYTAGHE